MPHENDGISLGELMLTLEQLGIEKMSMLERSTLLTELGETFAKIEGHDLTKERRIEFERARSAERPDPEILDFGTTGLIAKLTT